MKEWTPKVQDHLNILKENGKSSLTAEVRKISLRLFRELKGKPISEVYLLCENLLAQESWAMGVISYDIAFRMRKHYTIDTFQVFEKWLKTYVKDWGDCDDFCTHAFGALLLDYPDLNERVKTWCSDDNFAVRRAAPVVMIYSIRKGQIDSKHLFWIADQLMKDDHYLVQKGYGWMLKEYSSKEPKLVENYLRENVSKMERVAFRYALSKLDEDVKKDLMSL